MPRGSSYHHGGDGKGSRRLAIIASLILLCLVQLGPSTAFRPPLLSEELGCSPTLSMLLGRKDGFYFDPLKIANDANFARLREAELKHGRICMLAIVGATIPPFLQLFAQEIGMDYTFPSASIVQNLRAASAIDYLNIFVTCGFLENFIFIQRDPKDMPGDYGTGYFSIRDKGLNERSLVAELENGRLAMLSLVGLVAAEIVSGKSWLEQWDGILDQVTEILKQSP